MPATPAGQQPVAEVAAAARAAAPSGTGRRPRTHQQHDERAPPTTAGDATSGMDERTGDGSASSTRRQHACTT